MSATDTRRPIAGEVGALLFARHVERVRELLNTLDAFDAKRHAMGSVLMFESERADLRDTAAFLEHVRVHGYEVNHV